MAAPIRWLAGVVLIALAGCSSSPRQPPPDAPARTTRAVPESPPAQVTPPAPTLVESPAIVADEPTEAAETSFAPRDECSSQPGWPAFAERLRDAAKARDATALAELATQDITLDYGGGSGTDELKKRLADPKAALWHELDDALALGCAMQGGLAALPWYFWNIPDGTDGADTVIVTGNDIPLLRRPKSNADPITKLDWAMVTIDPATFDSKAPFSAVHTRTGKHEGYVATARLRSVLAYRLIAEPRDGDWRVTAFIAGD